MKTTSDAGVERGEQRVLAVLTQVGAGEVRQQHDAVGKQVVERPFRLGHGLTDVGHRKGGEEPEPVWPGGYHAGAVVVEVARQRRGVGGLGQERATRGRDGQDCRGDVQLGHGLQ